MSTGEGLSSRQVRMGRSVLIGASDCHGRLEQSRGTYILQQLSGVHTSESPDLG